MKLLNKKTGEIAASIDVSQDYKSIWVFGKHPRVYHTLAELNEEWEDFGSLDPPFIKDEKLRMAVKAWADYYSIKRLKYRKLTGVEGHYLSDIKSFHSIDADVPGLIEYQEYTITELCGLKNENKS